MHAKIICWLPCKPGDANNSAFVIEPRKNIAKIDSSECFILDFRYVWHARYPGLKERCISHCESKDMIGLPFLHKPKLLTVSSCEATGFCIEQIPFFQMEHFWLSNSPLKTLSTNLSSPLKALPAHTFTAKHEIRPLVCSLLLLL